MCVLICRKKLPVHAARENSNFKRPDRYLKLNLLLFKTKEVIKGQCLSYDPMFN